MIVGGFLYTGKACCMPVFPSFLPPVSYVWVDNDDFYTVNASYYFQVCGNVNQVGTKMDQMDPCSRTYCFARTRELARYQLPVFRACAPLPPDAAAASAVLGLRQPERTLARLPGDDYERRAVRMLRAGARPRPEAAAQVLRAGGPHRPGARHLHDVHG